MFSLSRIFIITILTSFFFLWGAYQKLMRYEGEIKELKSALYANDKRLKQLGWSTELHSSISEGWMKQQRFEEKSLNEKLFALHKKKLADVPCFNNAIPDDVAELVLPVTPQ